MDDAETKIDPNLSAAQRQERAALYRELAAELTEENAGIDVISGYSRQLSRAFLIRAKSLEAQVETEPAPEPANEPWVVRNVRDCLWWRPKAQGYTGDLLDAGIFTREQAELHAKTRKDDLGRPHEKAMPLFEALEGLHGGDESVLAHMQALASASGSRADAFDTRWTKKPEYETLNFEDHLGHFIEETDELTIEALTASKTIGKILRFGEDNLPERLQGATNLDELARVLPKITTEAADLRLSSARLLARVREKIASRK